MYNTNNAPSLADIAAVTENNGLGGNSGWWILIILFAIFGGWGNGGFNNGNAAMAEFQRGFDTNSISQKINQIGDGIASLGYDQLAQMNGINTNISNNGTQTREAISNVKYDIASGFCTLNNNLNQQAQLIMQNDNANYRALHDEMIAIQMEGKNQRIAELQAQVQALNLTASQQAQNAYLINQLKPCPIPAYTVASPYASANACLPCTCS